jgi:hypothetical protein
MVLRIQELSNKNTNNDPHNDEQTDTDLTHADNRGSHNLSVASLEPDAIRDRKGCQSKHLTSFWCSANTCSGLSRPTDHI